MEYEEDVDEDQQEEEEQQLDKQQEVFEEIAKLNSNETDGTIVEGEYCRVFCVSDIHTDHKRNWKTITSWKQEDYNKSTDILIVAGDISTNLELVKEALLHLRTLFDHIFYCPGNNELRLRSKENFKHSVEKFHFIIKLCTDLGIYVTPKKINGVWIVPLFGWYTPYFDASFDKDLNYQKGWLDFYKVKWPEEDMKAVDDPSKFFLSYNEKLIATYKTDDTSPVITYSHFLPRFELLPSRLFIKKSLPLVVGCTGLEDQLRNLKSRVHVCGHTHINVDKVISGVRYVQNALGHPNEQKAIWNGAGLRGYYPKLVFQSGTNGSSTYCQVM